MKSGVFDKKAFIQSVRDNLKNLYRKTLEEADQQEIFQAVSFAVKDVINDRWLATQQVFDKEDPKIVYYMSMEFLMGRALGNNLINLKEYKEVREALDEIGLNLDVIEDQEPDPALGNGGLGRLAACFMDSLSTLGYAAYGCGIRYRYGMFKQKIQDGFQVEVPDNWLKNGYPFELHRPEYTYEIKFGGHVRTESREDGSLRFVQEDYQSVLAIPYDMPVVGYGNNVVNTLMIWDAAAKDYFELDSFDKGDYQKAVEQQNLARNLVEVLYPNDNHVAGKELRLKQQYFFVSASVQRALARYKKNHDDIRRLPEKVTFQLNDTHPTVTVAELMRILVDEEGLGWDEAWDQVSQSVAYTNHTVMSEALEKWPQDLVQTLLPRVWEILCEINRRWCEYLVSKFGNSEKVGKNLIIQDGQVHMANLCLAACYKINGVSGLHGEILKKDLFKDVCQLRPERFTYVTNGIDHRRWLAQINPRLNGLVSELLEGDDYLTKPEKLIGLLDYAENVDVQRRVNEIKRLNKYDFAKFLAKNDGFALDPDAILDVQVKRLHEYKRQLLCAMLITRLQMKIHDDPNADFMPVTFVFGAKAAAGYYTAKRIIELICSLADDISRDPLCKGKLQVCFMENYRVSAAEALMPAAQVSEQISTAGKEASGTGNMKLMLNGAVTIGTLDGANVEMYECLGDKNMFLFGLKTDEVGALKASGYDPQRYAREDAELGAVLDRISRGFADGKSYSDLVSNLLYNGDPYMLCADFRDYVNTHDRMYSVISDPAERARLSITNTAEAGIFAADRAIKEYAEGIWGIKL